MLALHANGTATLSVDRWLREAVHPLDRDRLRSELDAALQGAVFNTEYRAVGPDGNIRIIHSLATAVVGAAASPLRLTGLALDVTALHTARERERSEKAALADSEKRHRALIEAIPQIVSVVGSDGRLEYVNARWTQYTGYTLEEVRAAGRIATLEAEGLALLNSHRLRSPATEFECEVRLRRHDGVFRWQLFRSVPIVDDAGLQGWIVSATDIEDRKTADGRLARASAEIAHLAHHDPLTNLPNRKFVMERLAQAIAKAARNNEHVTVLFLDLDRFKNINDRLGHSVGDRILTQTAQRLSRALRADDTAGRVGGDEFVMICAGHADADEGLLVANRLLAVISEPIDVDGDLLTIAASIGISRYPADDRNADALVRKADVAMASAKQSGRHAIRMFAPEMNVMLAATIKFETEIRAGIAARQFAVYYQPMIDVRSGRLSGGEALVRWQHPQRGLLQPGDFIAFAEEHGYILDIGALVLDRACAQIKRLEAGGNSDFRIAVNVAAPQFQHADFVRNVAATIALHAIDVRHVELEITESMVMGNTAATIRVLHELKALGVKLSLDDFGTGYSSLAYIKNFPIDTLKIDRSFVRDIATDRTDQALAKTIITLAHSLGMRVVGEGVETAAQLDVLRAYGADSCQGYYFSRPLPAEQFERFERTYRPLVTA